MRKQQRQDKAKPRSFSTRNVPLQMRCSPVLTFSPSGATSPAEVQVSDYQRHAFNYFCGIAKKQLQLNISSAKWTQLALQLSFEAPVFQAIAALGGGYRTLVQTTHVAFACRSEDDPRALSQYCKAVASLRRHLDGAVIRPASLEPVLLTCLLLMTFELIRSDSKAAVSHLRLGRQLARDYMLSGIDGQRTTDDALRPQSAEISRELVSLFDQLEEDCVVSSQVHAGLTRSDQCGCCSPANDLPLFATVEGARAQLDTMITAGHDLRMGILNVAQSEAARQRPSSTIARRNCIVPCLSRTVNLKHHAHLQIRLQSLISGHNAWLEAFQGLLDSPENHSQAVILMQVRHFYSAFLLSTCRETQERRCDFFSSHYIRALDLLEQFLANAANENLVKPQRPGPRPNFTLDAGILPTLFLICLKCRDSLVRRRALRILQRADRLEGFLQSRMLAMFAECIIDLEEQNARKLSGGLSMMKDLTADQVPEAARFLDVVVSAAPTSLSDVHLVCGRFAFEGDGGLEITEYRGTGPPLVLVRV